MFHDWGCAKLGCSSPGPGLAPLAHFLQVPIIVTMSVLYVWLRFRPGSYFFNCPGIDRDIFTVVPNTVPSLWLLLNLHGIYQN